MANPLQNAAGLQNWTGGLGQANNPWTGLTHPNSSQQSLYVTYAPPSLPVLTDNEICLMAVCIQGGHKPMDGKAVCFCDALRVQKGISEG